MSRQPGHRNDALLSLLTASAGVVASVLGTLVSSGAGSVLAMVGVLLVLVRALLGASPAEHARRARIAREVSAGTPPALRPPMPPLPAAPIVWSIFASDHRPPEDRRPWTA